MTVASGRKLVLSATLTPDTEVDQHGEPARSSNTLQDDSERQNLSNIFARRDGETASYAQIPRNLLDTPRAVFIVVTRA